MKDRKVTRHDLGRDAFVAEVWKWKEQYGTKITSQLRHLGVSVDWSRERFTMDSMLSEGVKEAFVRMYEDGLISRYAGHPGCFLACSHFSIHAPSPPPEGLAW